MRFRLILGELLGKIWYNINYAVQEIPFPRTGVFQFFFWTNHMILKFLKTHHGENAGWTKRPWITDYFGSMWDKSPRDEAAFFLW